MFDFGPLPDEDNEDIQKEKNKLDIGEVLKHIDAGDEEWFGTLPEEKQKQFAPFVVLRWASSFDDSVLVTYKAKDIESLLGSKWSSGAKEMLNEIKDAFNKENNFFCSSVQKYEHAKFDWRIKFSLCSKQGATAFINQMKTMGFPRADTFSSVDSEFVRLHIQMMNDVVNKNLFDMNSHPELLYRMMCTVNRMFGSVEAGQHSWIPFVKGMKTVNSKVYEVLKKEEGMTQFNSDEYKIIVKETSSKQFDEILQGQACDDSERKALMKLFKTEKDKYQ